MMDWGDRGEITGEQYDQLRTKLEGSGCSVG